MKQYGFFFYPALCTGCQSCQFACREANHLSPGIYLRRVLTLESADSAGYTGFFSAGCSHCQEPACVAACQNGAMYRDPDRGVVLHDDQRCIGCSACLWACPYGAVTINPMNGKAVKCDSCLSRREQGQPPACTAACPTKALRFGSLDDLEAQGGCIPDSRYLPDGGATHPSIRVFPLVRKEEQP